MPNLIHDFHAYVPPGYRTVRGFGNDSNTSRMTTPTGPESSSNAFYGSQLPDILWQQPPNSVNSLDDVWWQQPHNSIERPNSLFGPQRAGNEPSYGQNQFHSAYEAAPVHHQQQRGVSQFTNPFATPPRDAQTPTLGQFNLMDGNQAGMEQRRPVEHHHAVDYIKKVKVSATYCNIAKELDLKLPLCHSA